MSPRALLPILATATFFLATGCSNPTLAGLSHRRLVVDANNPERIVVDVEYDESDGCADLDHGHKLSATINGNQMRIESRGEPTASTCLPIQLTGSLGFAWKGGPVVIRVEDDSDALEVELADLRGDRRVELAVPADGQIFVGDRIALRWLQAEEDVEPFDVTFETPFPVGSSINQDVTVSAEGLIELTVPSIDDDSLTFPVPGGLRVSARVRPRPRRCEGAESCEASYRVRRVFGAGATFNNHPR